MSDTTADLVRLSKRMSELGLCSRREADEWIAKGWVKVDGEVVSELGSKVRPDQKIKIDRKAKDQQNERVTIILNKPLGYVSGQAEDGHEPARVLITPRNRCLIDDNPNKWGRYMEGVPVVGGRDDIFLNVDKYHINQILLAIPTATPHQKRDILNICKETGCELKQLPGVYQLVNGEVSLSKMKKVAVEDLLGRDTIKVNMSEIFQYLKGKRILVTGGGGSIGAVQEREAL